ncbi:hypothetical protein WJT74_10135 [Sphingomicrobium sp. XHP0239]|uniref:tetratricopeptide repeat protein n=1 Tax=Sphingomicrobium maritimum TaxID=3133972 RepID=UPI0031CC6DA2
MILSLIAALTLAGQEAPPLPPAVCADSERAADLECKAQAEVRTGNYGAAAAHFLTIANNATDPGAKARAYAAAAPLLSVAGELDRAQEIAAAALAFNALGPQQAGWTMIDRAQALFRLDRVAEAETQWARAAELIAPDPYYWWTGASMALQAGDLAAANERVEAGLERADDAPELHLLKGQIRLAEGDTTGARAAFSAAVEAQPGHDAALAAARALAALNAE